MLNYYILELYYKSVYNILSHSIQEYDILIFKYFDIKNNIFFF